MKRYWKSYLAGSLAVLCTNGIMVQAPRIIQRIVDDLNHGVTHGKLLTWCWLLVAVALSKGIFQFLTRWIMIGISREIEFDLRNDLFRHLESLDPGFYQRTRTGDIMARATNDLNAVRTLLGPGIMYSANTVVFTIAALYLHAPHQSQAHPVGVSPAARRQHHRAVLRQPASISASSASRPSSATSAPAPRRTSPAPASSAPTRRKNPKSRSSREKTPTTSTARCPWRASWECCGPPWN